MKILIAPDKFKNSLGARPVAESIAQGLREVLPDAVLVTCPIADGGEGTASVIGEACGGEWCECPVRDALGREIKARYVWLPEMATAVLEMSEAAGLWRIAPHERDLLRSDTYGVGEMILDATRRGAGKIIIGLGGSATNDGGFGMARALGCRFFNRNNTLAESVADLADLTRIETSERVALPPIVAAADVRNPLLGTRGATHVFGPQKGAAYDQLAQLEQALVRLANVTARDLGCDYREAEGSGAAGGLAFGLVSYCNGQIRSGFDLVATMIGLEAKVRDADMVITGEGSLDQQTLEGKAAAGVAHLARKHGKPIYAIVGQTSGGAACENLFDGVCALARGTVTVAEAMMQTTSLLRMRARELASSTF
ncbi:MAG: glycerate kinase [Verrucomicrobiota bacterium]